MNLRHRLNILHMVFITKSACICFFMVVCSTGWAKWPDGMLAEERRAEEVARTLIVACEKGDIPIDQVVFLEGYVQPADESWEHFYFYENRRLNQKCIISISIGWSGWAKYSVDCKPTELR